MTTNLETTIKLYEANLCRLAQMATAYRSSRINTAYQRYVSEYYHTLAEGKNILPSYKMDYYTDLIEQIINNR